MARVIGYMPFNGAEREVVHQLKQQLPADWLILPGVRWAQELKQEGRAPFVRDGEADCVVLAPGFGMLVIEVKGSAEFKVDDDARWFRRDRGIWTLLDESPESQATRNMHDLKKLVCNALNWGDDFPGRYGFMVAYPRGEAAHLSAMFDASTLLTRRHMNQLKSRTSLALEKRGPPSLGERFSLATVESVATALTRRGYRIVHTDGPEEIRDDRLRIEELTKLQFAVLRGLFELPRVAAIGPAGSGKTLLAIWRLQALLEEEANALYVCFNRDLAASLRQKNPQCSQAITNVDSLFRGICPSEKPGPDLRTFFREELPFAVMDKAADNATNKFDAILVDEGQDFSEEQLLALMELLKPEGKWAFFADWRQELFEVGQGTAFGAEVLYRLDLNCRNTVSVNRATNSYLKQAVKSMPGMPEGVEPVVEKCRNQATMATRAWELAKKWSGEGPVVILSPYTLERSAMAGNLKGHALHLSEDVTTLGEDGVVYFSTIRSFKGIEAASVILVDARVPGDHPAFGEEDLYVACTRATVRLAILVEDEQARQFYASSAA